MNPTVGKALAEGLERRRAAGSVFTGAELAAEIGVSARTVYRYIRDLRAGGMRIKGDPGFGYVVLNPKGTCKNADRHAKTG